MQKNRSNFPLNESSLSHEKIYNIQFIIYQVSYYEQFGTIPLGIIGNMISIFIFSRPSLNKNTNTGFLFTILCLINIFIILYNAIFKWEVLKKLIIRNLQIHFKMEMFLERVIGHSLSWIQALISFDRFITVFFPVKGARIMNKKWALFSIIFGLLVFISSANSIHFIYYSPKSSTTNKNNIRLIYLIYKLIDMLMKICIPYLIIMVFDIMVILRLKRSKKEFRSRQSRRSRSSKFTINTIIIDLIFLIFNIPSILSFYYYLKFNELSFYNDNSGLNFNFALRLYELLSNIYSRLFFILFLIFNRIFRYEFISIFKRNRCFNNVNASLS